MVMRDRNIRRQGKRGSVPVLLMVLLGTMLLVIGTVTEVSSEVSSRSYVRSVTDSAGRSVLSMYNPVLLQTYGLFGRTGSDEAVKSELTYYISSALTPQHVNGWRTEGERRMDSLEIHLNDASVSMDDFALTNMEQLEKQMKAFMQYRIIGDLASGKDSSWAREKIRGEMQNMTKASGEIQGMGKDQKFIQEAQKLFEQMDDLLKDTADLKPRWQQWQRCVESGDSEQAEALRSSLDNQWNYIRNQMRTTATQMESLEKQVDRERQVQQQLCQELEQGKGELLRKSETSLDQLPVLIEELEERNWLALLERMKIRGRIHQYQREDTPEDSQGKKNRILKNQKIISRLPSVQIADGHTAPFSFATNHDLEWEDIEQRLYTVSYIQNRLGNRVNVKGDNVSFFQNEAEYVLVGSFSDEKNASAVKAQLFALRSTANLIHIYVNKDKRSEIRALAASLTPGPGMALTEFLIAVAWSCGEARYDMNCLLEGKAIPLLKSRDQWKLGLTSALAGELPAVSEDANEGLTYGQYLSLFMWIQQRETQLYRIMDIIQMNMQGMCDEDFQMQDCFGGFRAELEFSKKRVYGIWKNEENRVHKLVICHEY